MDDATVGRLRDAAEAASRSAYAPYSHFAVGAAVLTEDGQIFAGANVENAAYPLTVCAERNAIGAAVSSGRRRLRAVAIYTPTEHPTAPCGGCRQVINEFGPDAEIYSFCASDEVLHSRLGELLPRAFGPGNLSPRTE